MNEFDEARLDGARLDELEADVGPEELAALMDLVLDDLPVQHAAVVAGVVAGDPAAVARAAHTLKSLAALIGAGPVRDRAREIEALATDGRLDADGLRLGDLRDAVATAMTRLEARRHRPDG
ncbi:MAG: Hpt domain-containing protein [Acidimicrobiales bacterium]